MRVFGTRLQRERSGAGPKNEGDRGNMRRVGGVGHVLVVRGGQAVREEKEPIKRERQNKKAINLRIFS